MPIKNYLCLGIILILLSGCLQNISQEKNNDIKQVCWQNNCFNVELAVTSKQQDQGLQNRKKLDEDSGMLFIFSDENKRSFWMKDTLIPLDIIFIDKNKQVVSISEDAQPCLEEPCPSYKSKDKAQYVLEINGDVSEKIGLTVGSTLQFIY